MSLRIACDLDGTLADMESALQDAALRLFGPTADLPGRGLTDHQVRELWAHVGRTENFWMSLKEIEPGAVERLAAAARTHRWEVLFLTQRPPSAGYITQVQSQRWLQARGFELPSVYVISGRRGRVAGALGIDVVLDDRAENCIDVVATSKARAILVWRGPRPAAPPGAARVGIEVVFSIAEALELVQGLRRSGRGSGSLVARFRQAIGI